MNTTIPPHDDASADPAADASNDPWGEHAATYDRTFAPLTGYVARTMLAVTETRTPPGSCILDIGCGSGALFLPAVERALQRRRHEHADRVVGCDISPGMVAMAYRRAAALYDSAAFRCEVQDGQALCEPDATYDAAFSCFGIFLFPDRRAGWREAARVLKPGGVFSTSTWLPPEDNEMFRVQFGPIMEALPSRLTEGMAPSGWLEVANPQPLKEEVRDAGFVDVEVLPFRTTFVLPSARSAWAALLDNPAGGALLKQCNDAERETVRQAFFASLRRHAGGEHRPVPVQASCNILVARRAAPSSPCR